MKNLLPLLCFFVLILWGCEKPSPIKAPEAKDPDYFLWQQGRLDQVGSLENLPEKEWLPWTEAVRIVDMAQFEGSLWYGVNKKGIGQFGGGFFSDPLFRDRSTLSLFPYGGKLNIHLYFNTLFGEKTPEMANVNLLEFDGEGFTPKDLPFVFDRQQEVTGLVQRKSGDWALEVKKDEGERVFFDYYLYHPGREIHREISPGNYRSSYDFILPPDAPAIFVHLIEELQRHYGPNKVIHLTLETRGQTFPDRYQIGSTRKLLSGEADLISLIGYWNDAQMALYLPEGAMLFLDHHGQVSEYYPLPDLPPEIRLTSLIWTEKGFFFTWEEQDFYWVRNSGLIFLPSDYFVLL